MIEEKCWAESLGGCGGLITSEHLLTKSLFGNRIRIEGGFLGTPTVETSIRKLTANILCREHNNELGRTADAEALRLYRHLRASHRPMELPGSRILRPPVDRRISGVNFGRWLCKTHCNYMTVHGMIPDPLYIHYAFLQVSPKPIYFYLDASLGEAMLVADSRYPVVSWSQIVNDRQPDFDGFFIALAGFKIVVSTEPLQRNGTQMIDRIRVVEWPTPLGPFRVVFDWNGEPLGSLPPIGIEQGRRR